MVKLFFLLILISCSTTNNNNLIKINNVNLFNKLLKEFKISTKTPIVYKDLPGKAVAACDKNTKNKIIYVNKKRWDILSKIEKKLVLVHEIGHCDKLLKHNSDLKKDGCPKSIMNPTVFSISCFLKYEKQYLDEVF